MISRKKRRRGSGEEKLQTSDALGAAASQIGPDAQAAAATLHTQIGLSHGKVAAVFDALFGITLTRGACAQISGRAGVRLEPQYRHILASIRASKQLSVDETGWRVGGHPAWLHAWVGVVRRPSAGVGATAAGGAGVRDPGAAPVEPLRAVVRVRVRPEDRADELEGRAGHPPVFETCRRHTRSVVDHVSQTMRWFGHRMLPRPLLFGR